MAIKRQVQRTFKVFRIFVFSLSCHLLQPFSYGTKGMDCENSEESTTAASAPTRDSLSENVTILVKSRMNDPVEESSSNSLQCSPQEGHDFESNRKSSGKTVDTEKADSHSSVEPNPRSSNLVMMQDSEDNVGKEIHIDNNKESVGENDESLREDSTLGMSSNARKEDSDFNHPLDPLLSSVQTLQSIQEALEREVQKFSEIDRETLSPGDNSGMSVGPPDDQLDSAQISQSASSSEVAGISTFLDNVKNLDVNLDEARTLLRTKDSKAFELESTIDTNNFHGEEYKGTVAIQPGICKDTKRDGLHKQKLQCAARGPTNPLKRCKKQHISNTEMMSKQSATEENALLLKKLTKSSKELHTDTAVAEDIVKLHAQKLKATSFFFLQLILVVLLAWWFMMPLPPQRRTFVPT